MMHVTCYTVKPGSHIPQTCLGHSRRHSLVHRYSICEHKNFIAESLSVPGIDCWLACEVELGSTLQCTPVRRFIFAGEMVEIVPIRFAFRTNLSTSATNRRCTGYPLEPIALRTPATVLQVGQRDTRTTLNSSVSC